MKKALLALCLPLVLFGCANNSNQTESGTNLCDKIDETVDVAKQQIGYQVKLIEDSGTFINPRTTHNDDIVYVPEDDWTSGFFPGCVWYMYELTKEDKWKDLGVKYTEALDSVKYLKWHHDVGFMINCSFGNAYRLTENEAYKDVIIEAAKSLSSRFRPAAGVIQSWDEDRGWQGERGWMCPVIIDNMMNLELLFEASKLSGDSTYRDIAISHADTTMKYQFREDNSCYHVVDYDKIKGGMRSRCTAQGYADESAWARGQAWAIYGYTVCYRETKDPKYLEMAKKVYDFIFTHPNLPSDLVPYWDYDVPEIPNTPRDASAAACTASALYELSEFIPEYKATADKIMDSLTSPAYRAIVGTNGNFLLMHSVGSIPHHTEIDVPLNYADYYFLEAMVRKRALDCNQK
ncbi:MULTISPECIES: glycoside hydrolase family 88 protein [Bacteroides]|uniref:glycoside hydrolase family 88 protein n=1 Tax=Bacteroides TaxID=816 RepID=UPI001D1C7AB2|nr:MULTISPECIES: glycoside hydrolase family 88 protein [Bacteroides]HJD92209.1 glycoside hydrolase family 88 protein [Bacteroides coprosuis]